MSSILDVIGSVLIGGLILLTIFNALSNVQVFSYNTQLQISLNKMSEDLITGRKVNGEDYPGLTRYLSKVGAGVPTGTTAILEATSNSFRFFGQMSVSSSIRMIYIVQESQTSEGYPIYVYNSDMSTSELGPFWLADSLNLTYYDVNNTIITLPNSNRDLIRSIKVDLIFFYDTLHPDIDKRIIRHRIVFWRYFKNLYL